MTPDEVADLFSFLGASYPRWNVTPATINAYAMGLEDCDAESVWAAVKVHQRNAKWEPSVAEIREMIQAEAGPKHMPWDEAWEMARESVGPAGCGRAYDFPPLVQAAVKSIGGFKAIGMCEEKDRPFLARRFRDAYESRCDLAARNEDLMIAKGEEPELPESITRLLGGFGTVPGRELATSNGGDRDE